MQSRSVHFAASTATKKEPCKVDINELLAQHDKADATVRRLAPKLTEGHTRSLTTGGLNETEYAEFRDALKTRSQSHDSIMTLTGGKEGTVAEMRTGQEPRLKATERRIVEVNEPAPGFEVRQEARAQETAEAFHRAGAKVGPANLSAQNKQLDEAFRSAILEKNPAPLFIPVDRTGEPYRPGVEQRDLLKTTATQALPVSVYQKIIAHMVDTGGVLGAGATVLNTPTGEDLVIGKSTAFSTANATNEGSAFTESDPSLGVVTLKAYKYGALFQISHELANDSSTDLLSFLAAQAGTALNLKISDKFINGVGSTEPRGILLDAAQGKVGPVGTATSLGTQATANQGTDLLWDLVGSVAEPYATSPSAAFLLRNASLTIARKLKDSAGNPVALSPLFPYPFVLDAFVPAMAANAKSVLFGDWSRYFVRIVEGIRFERSDDYAFDTDMVTFRAVIRVDGAAVDNNAIKHFANSAT